MAVVASSHAGKVSSGPRRMDPSFDLAQVADLIEEGFADELDREGLEVLQELRRLGRLGPLLWLLRQMSPDFGEMLSGFVWVEDGRIVGNTSLNLVSAIHPQWRISNVAVRPPYRGRGIARRLMDEAIAAVRRRRGRIVSLQVRDDNAPALGLYRSMGFTVVATEMDLMLPVDQTDFRSSVKVPSPDGAGSLFTPRRVAAEEWPDVYSLVLLATPEEDQRLAPLQKLDFQLDGLQALSDAWTTLVTGRRTYRWVVDSRSGLAGYLSAVTAPRTGGPHRLMLWTHPRYEGRVERALLETALEAVLRHSLQPVQIKLNPVKKQAVDTLLALGFNKRRTLLTMELRVE
jgi:ribosomal protein S18 acetylase RimI-like enzyme